MNKRKIIISLVIITVTVLLGFSVGTITQYQRDQQTLQASSNLNKQAVNALREQVGACQEDPSSSNCITGGNTALKDAIPKETCSTLGSPTGFKTADGTDVSNASAADIIWHFRHCSAPTPQPNYQSQTTSVTSQTYLNCSGHTYDNGTVDSQCYPETVNNPVVTTTQKSKSNAPVSFYKGQ